MHFLKKLLLIMHFTAILLLTVSLGLSAAGLSQKLTLQVRDVDAKTVFAIITSQTGYTFAYADDLKLSKKITIKLTNATIEEALTAILKDQPFTFSLIDKTVVIRDATVNRNPLAPIIANDDISGLVTDENGKPMEGVSVFLKGSSVGTVTDSKGMFKLANVNLSNAVLVFSYVGYEEREVALKGKKSVVVKMEVMVKEVGEVEVLYSTGYQDIPKERATGSFVQIDNKLINRSVSTNILDRILNITSSLRTEKGKTTMSIRGYSTINANMKPLIVVDGFPYEEGDPTASQVLLNNLNPNDVEDITILRDAASASIWGARSGNGVIVIKTKKGAYNRKMSVQVNANLNIIEKPDLYAPKVIGSEAIIQFERMRFQRGEYNDYDNIYPSFKSFPPVSAVIEILLAQRRGAISSGEADAQINLLAHHDVRDDLNKYFLQTGINQQYNVNINGGTGRNNYYASIGYDKNRSSSVGNDGDRFTLRLENTFKPIDKLELNTYVNYTQGVSKGSFPDYSSYLPYGGASLTPAYNRLADENGNPLHVPTGSTLRTPYLDSVSVPGLLDWHYRPLEELRNSDNRQKEYSVRLGGHLRYNIIPGLNFEIKGQYERRIVNERNYYNDQTYQVRNLVNSYLYLDPAGKVIYPVPLGAILESGNGNQYIYNIRNQLTLNRTWNIHQVNAIAGYEVSENKYEYDRTKKYGFDPLTLTTKTDINYGTSYQLRPASSGTIPSGDFMQGTLNRFQSYFGNAGYTYNNKYTATLSGRVDESNFLGAKQNQRFVPLWHAGLSWNISNENFYDLQWFPYLKLRATYGYNGNLNNRATALPTARVNVPNNVYHGESYLYLLTPPNPGLTWEKIKTINFGVDFQLKNNRVNGEIEFYTKKGINLIGLIQADPTSGFPNYTGNYASIQGKGLDIILNTMNIQRRSFSWNSTFALSYNTDRVTDYDESSASTASYLSSGPVTGKPLSHIFSYTAAPLDPQTGSPRGYLKGEIRDFATVMQNAMPEDLSYYGSGVPKVFGNFLNTISYKELSLSFNIIYRLGYYFFRESISYYGLYTSLGGHADYYLRWQKPGDEMFTTVPSMPASINSNRDDFYRRSDNMVERGDHIRLQDVRISYTLKKNSIPGLPVSAISIFSNANNLGIIWRANKYGVDPDINGLAVPPQKSIAFGITVTF